MNLFNFNQDGEIFLKFIRTEKYITLNLFINIDQELL